MDSIHSWIEKSRTAFSKGLEPHVPLLVWALVVLTLLLIPFKIISYGYMPPDDAPRHVAKAISGKSWQEILVMRPEITMDQHFGWHTILGFLDRTFHPAADTLVIVSVVGLCLLYFAGLLTGFKRPESVIFALSLCRDGKADKATILITHGHLDHIGGISDLSHHLPVEIWMHRADHYLYLNLRKQGSVFGLQFEEPPAITGFIENEQRIPFGIHGMLALHTPGHSRGGVCYYCKEEGLLFTGDTLFADSIGRTDLDGGDEEILFRSIHEKLLSLPEDVRVFPGHGMETTIGREKRRNPFLQALAGN